MVVYVRDGVRRVPKAVMTLTDWFHRLWLFVSAGAFRQRRPQGVVLSWRERGAISIEVARGGLEDSGGASSPGAPLRPH